ncbi:ABC transporter permease [Embleya scabrispora]|uniref:ABC transporter permease n=1 Tax=Embleya scabrispora TaxID=159449 RepID=UPI000370BEF1|nr:ABC transporter permease [Embleya scabrispora]MYS86213.1 ABC transporter permease subunit [Streptomyces sp. SID5474]
MNDSAAPRIAASTTSTVPSPTPAKPAPAKDKPRRRIVLERFLRHRLAVVGLVILSALAIACFGAHWIAPYPHNRQDLLLGAQQPSSAHWLGTDALGRDYLSELLFAGQVSLAVGICVALLSTVVGTAVGAIAGFAGGWADEVIMRVTDLFLIVPAIAVLALALQALGPSPVTIVLVLSALGWTMIARVVRSQVLTLRNKEFIQAARVIGASNARIVVRHLLPNLTGVIAVNVSLAVASAIILESTTSFLGFGIQPPQSSWGNMLSQAAGLIGTSQAYLLYVPGLAILITVLAVNFVGDGLRDAFDPQGRQ